MNMFGNWFRKAAPVRDPGDEPISPVFVVAGTPVRFLSSKAIMTADVALRKCPQLFRVVNFVASSVQSVPWYCEPDPDVIASEQAPATTIKAINSLLKSPNGDFTPQALEYWLAINLMLYARAHFKVGVGTTGLPNGIYPLAAKYMHAELNNRGTVENYVYGLSPETQQRYPSRRTAEKRGLKEAYAAEISFPSLTGLVEYNKSPAAIESIAIPIAIITCLMQRALDTAAGHPNIKYVITAEKTLTKQQKEALTKHLEESAPGEEDSGNVLFLYNTTITVHKLDNDLKDVHSKIPLDDMTRQIAGVFGVPIPLLGLGSADAAKFTGNYAEARLAFWQDTVVPCYLSPVKAGMTQSLCPYGARVCFDLDAVPALWEGRSKLGQGLSKVTVMTTTEKREVLGLEPTDKIPEYIAPKGKADQPVVDENKSADIVDLPRLVQ